MEQPLKVMLTIPPGHTLFAHLSTMHRSQGSSRTTEVMRLATLGLQTHPHGVAGQPDVHQPPSIPSLTTFSQGAVRSAAPLPVVRPTSEGPRWHTLETSDFDGRDGAERLAGVPLDF